MRISIGLVGVLAFFVTDVRGQDTLDASGTVTPEEITPAHVFQRVAILRDELELIRLEMGRPKTGSPPFTVTNAAPREVFFQAIALFRKADRLAFEHIRENLEEPPLPEGNIKPSHVFSVVTTALERVKKTKESLEIVESSPGPALQSELSPSDVYDSILSANREINNLLEYRFSPSDVYQQVTVAIAYMSRLLDSPDEVSTPPDPPAFLRRKRPPEVYMKLTHCYEDIRKIGKTVGHPMLELSLDEKRIEEMEPGDVYDVASLIVSELAYFHRQKKDAAAPRKVFNPGRKLPSHVYQRLGILCQQMKTLQERVNSDPDWLK